MERIILNLFIKFLTYYLLDNQGTPSYYGVASILKEAKEIVNKL